MSDLLTIAANAAREGKMLVLKLSSREPTESEHRAASVLVVRGQVVKNRMSRLGSWSEVQKDLGGTPLEIVEW